MHSQVHVFAENTTTFATLCPFADLQLFYMSFFVYLHSIFVFIFILHLSHLVRNYAALTYVLLLRQKNTYCQVFPASILIPMVRLRSREGKTFAAYQTPIDKSERGWGQQTSIPSFLSVFPQQEDLHECQMNGCVSQAVVETSPRSTNGFARNTEAETLGSSKIYPFPPKPQYNRKPNPFKIELP